MVDNPGHATHFSATVSAWRKAQPKLNWELPAVFLLGP